MTFHFSQNDKLSSPFVCLNIFDSECSLPRRDSVVYLASHSSSFVRNKGKLCIVYERADRAELAALCHCMLHTTYPLNYQLVHEQHDEEEREAAIAKLNCGEVDTVITSTSGVRLLPDGCFRYILVCFDGESGVRQWKKNTQFTGFLESKLQAGCRIEWRGTPTRRRRGYVNRRTWLVFDSLRNHDFPILLFRSSYF